MGLTCTSFWVLFGKTIHFADKRSTANRRGPDRTLSFGYYTSCRRAGLFWAERYLHLAALIRPYASSLPNEQTHSVSKARQMLICRGKCGPTNYRPQALLGNFVRTCRLFLAERAVPRIPEQPRLGAPDIRLNTV